MSICAPLVRRLIRRRISQRGELSDDLDGPQRAGGQGLRPRAAQILATSAGVTPAGRTRLPPHTAVVRRGAEVPPGAQPDAPRNACRRSAEDRGERGTPQGLRPLLHAAPGERGGEVDARGPGFPPGQGPSAGEPVQARRRLFRRGRQPSHLRRPLPRCRVDRRRRHGASARARRRPPHGTRSRAGIAGCMIQARSLSAESAVCPCPEARCKTRLVWEASMFEKNLPEVVSPEEWLVARKELLVKEKELTRARDRVNADRRRLPMVRVHKPYTFEGPDGTVGLLDLFEGRSW